VPELSPGDSFAGCRIDAVAGRGGMGVVYQATQLNLGRPVALKLITPDHAGDDAFRERFQRESRLAASIDHPNVVPVYEAGEADGHLYLVMRWVRGTDLHALLKREKRLAPDVAATIVAQVAAGLDAAHAAGLVHRDVKPANVLLSGEHAYLSDFGLSRLEASDTRLTDSGQWIGSVDYCSPEQLRGMRTDARADVYALACVLHAALTGRPPYSNTTVTATLLAHLNDPIPRVSELGLPQGFDRVLARGLAKDPAERYPSAGDLGRAALGAARGEPVTESERSVAVGPAAPEDTPTRVQTNGHDRTAATESLWQRRTPTPVQAQPVDPPSDYKRVRRKRRRFRSALAAVLAVVLAGAAAVALSSVLPDLGGGSSGAAQTSGPLTSSEVKDVANAWADAYGKEDPAAMRATLARDVKRVLPSGTTTGREAVVKEYQRQFAAQATQDYEISNLQAGSGRVARATGDYKVTRDGKPPIEGHLVLVVVRENGDPRIGLITATPTT
jgi:serine/threonine-protein kinase